MYGRQPAWRKRGPKKKGNWERLFAVVAHGTVVMAASARHPGFEFLMQLPFFLFSPFSPSRLSSIHLYSVVLVLCVLGICER